MISSLIILACMSVLKGASGRDVMDSKAPRVIFGDKAPKGAYPGFVVISILGYRTCGGVILSPNVVMTAGHCLEIEGFNFASLTNSLGIFQVGRGNIQLKPYTGEFVSADETSAVRKIIMHPSYSFVSMHQVENDIALLVLEEEFSEPFADIARKAPAAGRSSVAVGFGLNNDFSWPGPDGTEIGAPDRLYEVQLTVGAIGKTPCPASYDGGRINATTSVCAYGKAVPGGFPSICWGDSGGPLYNIDGEVFGLTSWEPDSCTLLTTPFNIFTLVPYYKRKFIDPVIQKYSTL